MKAQAASLPFTFVFAALVAIINTKLPQVGELVLTRIISQFRKSFKRNNKVGVFLKGSFFYLLTFLSLLDRLSFHNHLSCPFSQPIPRTQSRRSSNSRSAS